MCLVQQKTPQARVKDVSLGLSTQARTSFELRAGNWVALIRCTTGDLELTAIVASAGERAT